MLRRRRRLSTSQIILFIRLLCLLLFMVLVRYSVDHRDEKAQEDARAAFERYLDQQKKEPGENLDICYEKLRYSYFVYMFGEGL